jgi:hypothetical protein
MQIIQRMEVAFYYFLIGSALVGNSVATIAAIHPLF